MKNFITIIILLLFVSYDLAGNETEQKEPIKTKWNISAALGQTLSITSIGENNNTFKSTSQLKYIMQIMVSRQISDKLHLEFGLNSHDVQGTIAMNDELYLYGGNSLYYFRGSQLGGGVSYNILNQNNKLLINTHLGASITSASGYFGSDYREIVPIPAGDRDTLKFNYALKEIKYNYPLLYFGLSHKITITHNLSIKPSYHYNQGLLKAREVNYEYESPSGNIKGELPISNRGSYHSWKLGLQLSFKANRFT